MCTHTHCVYTEYSGNMGEGWTFIPLLFLWKLGDKLQVGIGLKCTQKYSPFIMSKQHWLRSLFNRQIHVCCIVCQWVSGSVKKETKQNKNKKQTENDLGGHATILEFQVFECSRTWILGEGCIRYWYVAFLSQVTSVSIWSCLDSDSIRFTCKCVGACPSNKQKT